MLRYIQSRLEFKILLLIVVILLAGFSTYVILTIRHESDALLQQQREKLRASSEALMAGIRSVMLTGKSPYAVEMVNDIRQNLRFVDVTIYDRFGREVFLREGEGVNMRVDDPAVASVLKHRTTESSLVNDGDTQMYTRYEPLQNRPECWRCHEKSEPMRGVLQLALKPSTMTWLNQDAAVRDMVGTMGNAIATAFRSIMLGGNGPQMDTLMATAREIPAVELVQVYNREGFLAFGPDQPELQDTLITRFTRERTTEQRLEKAGSRLRLFVPLENQDRCQVCHGSKYPMRGVMVIHFRKDTLDSYVKDPKRLFTEALQSTVFEGFRSIMLVGRASSVRFFTNELRSLAVLQTLRVFDRRGYEWFLDPPARFLPEFKSVVEKQDTMEFLRSDAAGDERMERVTFLSNENRCFSCHGSNHKVRGVVEVSTSMKTINAAIQANKLFSLGVGTVTLLLIWIVIRLFMRSVVVRPVQGIGMVASRVGQGDFSARADVHSSDEIGTLAKSMNEMVVGLRERFHLTKFVSQQTVEAIRSSDFEGVRLGGERRLATVFFSDIRGFTAYSEKVEPEKVVAMLNECLSSQAGIVRKYGGDIDKFVGDEMVAVFQGQRMVENALRAAVEIQRVVNRTLVQGSDKASIGIGINTGEMVMGAMGSPDRMDFTVIGDNVNLGARLCAAAKAGQILLSASAAAHLDPSHEFSLTPLDPIQVKGKTAPVSVFEVVWSA